MNNLKESWREIIKDLVDKDTTKDKIELMADYAVNHAHLENMMQEHALNPVETSTLSLALSILNKLDIEDADVRVATQPSFYHIEGDGENKTEKVLMMETIRISSDITKDEVLQISATSDPENLINANLKKNAIESLQDIIDDSKVVYLYNIANSIITMGNDDNYKIAMTMRLARIPKYEDLEEVIS